MFMKVEPNTKLFPAVFALPTSQNVIQFELGKLKVSGTARTPGSPWAVVESVGKLWGHGETNGVCGETVGWDKGMLELWGW